MMLLTLHALILMQIISSLCSMKLFFQKQLDKSCVLWQNIPAQNRKHNILCFKDPEKILDPQYVVKKQLHFPPKYAILFLGKSQTKECSTAGTSRSAAHRVHTKTPAEARISCLAFRHTVSISRLLAQSKMGCCTKATFSCGRVLLFVYYRCPNIHK